MKFKNICKYLFAGVLSLESMAATAQQLPYKDSKLPVEKRIEDLLGRMTLDEKVAQIRHLHSWNLFDGQALNAQKLKDASKGMAWGFVEGFPLTGVNCQKNFRLIQKYMVEETRLGIPIF